MKSNNKVTSIAPKSKIFFKKPTFIRSNYFIALFPIIGFVFANLVLIVFLSVYLNGGIKLQAQSKQNLQPAYNVYTQKPKESQEFVVSSKAVDARPEKVRLFFEKYNAPLQNYASFIVDMADKYQIDWRLVSAIGYCEGNGGKAIPEGSFNTWGWGASDKDLAEKSGKYNLGSWEQAIETVTKGLKNGYIDKGLNTPEEIMAKYAPPSVLKGGPWAKCVNQYLSEIEEIN